jgi:tetrapyrrole methylase family protein/MazG family protein
MQNRVLPPIESDSYLTVKGDLTSLNTDYDLLIVDLPIGFKERLESYFDENITLYILKEGEWNTVCLKDLSTCDAVFVPKQNFLNKKKFSFFDTVDILKYLRSDKGCPWDRAQTMLSIRANTIEEAYELVDAVEQKDSKKMTEEIGDVILQSLFYILMAEEENLLNAQNVFDCLCEKLITRHTHIFGSDKATDGNQALSVWEANKAKEKSFATHTQNLKDVPYGMPSLMRSIKVQKRAAKAGFDWTDKSQVIEKCLEEIKETLEAYNSQDKTATQNEMGDLLFSIVNLCRFLDVSPEVALNSTTNRFIRRFEYIEEQLNKQGKKFEEAAFEETDKLWKQAKEALCEE